MATSLSRNTHLVRNGVCQYKGKSIEQDALYSSTTNEDTENPYNGGSLLEVRRPNWE